MLRFFRSVVGKVIPERMLWGTSKVRKRVYYHQLPNTELGDIWLAVSKSGLVAVDFDISEEEFTNSTEALTFGRMEESEEFTVEIRNKVQEYIAGNSSEIDYPVDLEDLSPFQQDVLSAVKGISRGATATYSDVAKMVGKPKASRAVGQALSSNPIPIAIPCHRVVNADGTLGGYGGRMGSERKIMLLKLEGAILA